MNKKDKKNKFILVETIGELKKAIKDINDNIYVYSGGKYDFLLLEEFITKDKFVIKGSRSNKTIKISACANTDIENNDNAIADGKWHYY